ncbi:MAG: hypothetical protein WBB69_07740 [Anaerolineales bacterium]
MNKTKNNSLPRIIKVLLDLIFGLLIFVIAGLVVWMALSPILANRTDSLATASVPVTLGSGDSSSLEITFQDHAGYVINNAAVEEVRGMLRVETKNPLLILIANGAKLVVAAGLAYIFYLLRKVVQSFLDGDPFAASNIQHIRRLGYAVLLVGFGGGIIEGLAAWEILRLLPETIPALQAKATFDSRLVLGTSLFIFLLAQIWRYGLELERDRALTI